MKELLNKYWEGQTSLEEERELRDYFSKGSVAPEHEMYRSIFNTFEDENAMEMNAEFDAFAKLTPEEQPVDSSKLRVLKGIGIAAGLAALLAVGSHYIGSTSASTAVDTYDDPKEAYYATVQALQLVSTKLNNGRENLKPLEEINNKKDKVFRVTEQTLEPTQKVTKIKENEK